jgi:hypothetical protein
MFTEMPHNLAGALSSMNLNMQWHSPLRAANARKGEVACLQRVILIGEK